MAKLVLIGDEKVLESVAKRSRSLGLDIKLTADKKAPKVEAKVEPKKEVIEEVEEVKEEPKKKGFFKNLTK